MSSFLDLFAMAEEHLAGKKGTPFDATSLESMFRREYTRKYRVVVTNKYMTPTLVAQCPYLPLMYSPYVATTLDPDLYSYLIKRDAEHETPDDWQNWLVTDFYSTEVPGGVPGTPDAIAEGDVGTPSGNNGAQNKPEMEPPDIEWDPQEGNWAPPYDLRGPGHPFLNSAGDPYDPAPQFPRADTVLQYTRNELNFNVRKAASYNHAVNSKTFLGYPPLSVLCLPIKGVRKFKGTTTYVRTTYRFVFKAKKVLPLEGDQDDDEAFDFWSPVMILNQGTRARDDDPDSPTFGKAVPIWSKDGGGFVTSPVLLTDDGYEKAEWDPTGPPSYGEFVMHMKKDFNTLLVQGVGSNL